MTPAEPISAAFPARWVRWGEWAGKTAWQRCEGVELHGPWLVISIDGRGNTVVVPDHLVRGRVEISMGTGAADMVTTPVWEVEVDDDG